MLTAALVKTMPKVFGFSTDDNGSEGFCGRNEIFGRFSETPRAYVCRGQGGAGGGEVQGRLGQCAAALPVVSLFERRWHGHGIGAAQRPELAISTWFFADF